MVLLDYLNHHESTQYKLLTVTSLNPNVTSAKIDQLLTLISHNCAMIYDYVAAVRKRYIHRGTNGLPYITMSFQRIPFARNLRVAMEEVAKILTTHSNVAAVRVTLDTLVLVSIRSIMYIITN